MSLPDRFPRRGEIWAVHLPNQPTDQHTPRPGIIVSVDVRSRLASDVLIVPLSTSLRPSPTHVFIPRGAGGQRYDSLAKCEQATTLHKSFLVNGPLGRPVEASILTSIVQGIRRAVGEVLP